MKFSALTCACLVILAATTARLKASECPTLPPGINQRIEGYLSKRLVTGSNITPKVVSIEDVHGTCFRRIHISLSTGQSPVILFLSPDGRYLTSVVYDLEDDPTKEVARIASNVSNFLMRDRSPERSGNDPEITLVEFGDMQCPYCKRFSEWYEALPEMLRDKTTMVFKHLPLQQHVWAHSAALYGACINLQSQAAFWRFHDYVFDHQEQTTLDNLEATVWAALSGHSEVKIKEVKSCLEDGTGESIVKRDSAAAAALDVHSTPTIFIQGRRAMPLGSQQELRHLIEDQLQVNRIAVKGSTQRVKPQEN